MEKLNPLRYQALCTVTTFVTTLGAIAPVASFYNLVWWWGIYVMMFALVDIIRNGWRGLLWPAMVLTIMTIFNGRIALPVVVGVSAFCILTYLTIQVFRKGPSGLKKLFAMWRARRADKAEPQEPVSVTVRKPEAGVNAVEVLERLGLLKDLPQ